MHQIAKINHCETSILGGNGIAVKLRSFEQGAVSNRATYRKRPLSVFGNYVNFSNLASNELFQLGAGDRRDYPVFAGFIELFCNERCVNKEPKSFFYSLVCVPRRHDDIIAR